ncbi:MAG: N-acetylmuramoyl-L-alanine amidase [Alphaproteobacteria bacterium]
MRRLLVILACLMLAGTVAAQPRAEFGDFYALVIGNNEYNKLPRLETAVSDAGAVAELLKARYTFKEVELVINATRDDILGHLNRLRERLTDRDHLLIYYAGHGYLDRDADEGYWLPVDADPDQDTDWIATSRISRYMRSMTARHVLVVADSCYSGALTRDAGISPAASGERATWLARMAEKRGRTALTSGGLEPVVDGGRGGHSVFATAFLDALRENDGLLDGQSLFERVKTQVVLNADQTPVYANVRNTYHEGGDFIFVPKGATAPTLARAAPQAPANDNAMELAFWDSVRDSDDPAALRAYLAQYPGGSFAALARLRLARLETPAATPKPKTERALAPPAPTVTAPVRDARKRIIVLDPGHGGRDPGGIAVRGQHEKHITLAYAVALRDALQATGRYDVKLTRARDDMVGLRERVARARRARGDLLLSIHADMHPDSSVSGAVVYTLESSADTSTEGTTADVLAGVDLTGQRDEVKALVRDLLRRGVLNDGARFATALIAALDPVRPMRDPAHKTSAFIVLKALDVPSALVELANMGNPDDVAYLISEEGREALVAALVRAIDRYFDAAVPSRLPGAANR